MQTSSLFNISIDKIP